MELDNMKQLWQQLDATIQQQQNINETMIKKMAFERTGSALKVISNTEYTSLFASILLLMVFLVQAPRIGGHTGLIVCYALTLFFGLASLLFSWYKINYLNGLDNAKEAVSVMAEKTERFRMLITKERIIFVVLGPVLIGTFYIVVNYLIRGVNILENPMPYVFRFIAATVAYVVLVVIVYNKYYFRNLEKITDNLKEIAEFRKS